MNDEATVATWEVLIELGFEAATESQLVFDFGNFKLSAQRLINLTFREVVQFSGVLATRRTAAQVEFHLPLQLDSRAQITAMLAYYLDNVAGGVFQPPRAVPWLAEGRENRHLLPWAKPATPAVHWDSCSMSREWFRLVLKTLRETLSELPNETSVVFAFDGSVFTIRCAGQAIAASAGGAPWPGRFVATAGDLRKLPTRLGRDDLTVAVSRGSLRLGNRVYPCKAAPPDTNETRLF